MLHLIKHSDVSILARPIGSNIDASKVNTYINEAEQTQIKPLLGTDFFAHLVATIEVPSADDALLVSGDSSFCGLGTAVAYYAWAKIVKNSPINVTRFGTNMKIDDNSQQVSFSQILKIHDDAVAYGDHCMKEVVAFLSENADKYPLYKGVSGSVPVIKRSSIYSIGQ